MGIDHLFLPEAEKLEGNTNDYSCPKARLLAANIAVVDVYGMGQLEGTFL